MVIYSLLRPKETAQCSEEIHPEKTSAQAKKATPSPSQGSPGASASRTLTFGVEYEFLIASFPVGEPDPIKGGTDTRTIRFPITVVPNYWAIHQALKDELLEDDLEEFGACAEMVAQRLRNIGVPALSGFRGPKSGWRARPRDLAGLEVKMDFTVRNIEEEGNVFWGKEKKRADP